MMYKFGTTKRIDSLNADNRYTFRCIWQNKKIILSWLFFRQEDMMPLDTIFAFLMLNTMS